ncbi:hypothetical protein [Paraburkholderia dinghuensis]|uniref:Uncharacterized protein n=1 Tax=Paraburkholderia dinghuensis TaxID=2305225 RepID=A0A3N6MME3_9BURK|nr:hypothetical protein [Paraburkholderia dinghuensis]RQH04668.1 hypothetical protein D1Y85_17400 [Paraburkholderia dinghuensis]
MRRATFIASVVFAASIGALGSPAHADTHFEGRVLPVAASNVAASVDSASEPHPASSSSATAQRRVAPVASVTSTRKATHADTPFAFRGIPLGITLTALREANMVRATPHESELLCETDVAGGDIGMTIKSETSLTVACRWAHRTAQGWAPSRAVVDATPAADHVLRFAHASAGDPLRLYEMSFMVDDETAVDLRNMLAVHYGPPRVLGTPSLPLLVWDNAASTITICMQSESHSATLTYLLKPAGPRAKGTQRSLKISEFDAG